MVGLCGRDSYFLGVVSIGSRLESPGCILEAWTISSRPQCFSSHSYVQELLCISMVSNPRSKYNMAEYFPVRSN